MPRLTDEMLDFIASGVAHQVGGCTNAGRPLICRALAADQLDDGRVEVSISAEAGFELLEAIRANGRISLVFASPGSYRALHLKGRDAVVEAADDAPHHGLVARRLLAFQGQLESYGFPLGYSLALYALPEGALMAIRFTPEGAWSQTPGPGAGHALELKR
jgi:hypothetical protein